MVSSDVIIIGGGLAGLTAAIHLSSQGLKVIVFEKNDYPKHKVCGEYISNEVLPYLKWLNLNIEELHPTKITKLHFSSTKGKTLKANLPLGGFGISRFTLDDFLYKKALVNGCFVIKETVADVQFANDIFTITTDKGSIMTSKIVLGAYGKRASIDQKLQRSFIQRKSPWLAVKAHYTGSFPDDLVGLHNFKGGYCGVSRVENNLVNICYLADYDTFKHYKNIEEYQEKVVTQNPNLKALLESMTMVFEKPLTISQISFAQKKPVENHILMIGDTAGLIHPLCGNGMAMAIHSAQIASELVVNYCRDKVPSRKNLEKQYSIHWNHNFKERLRTGRWLSSFLQHPKRTEIMIRIITLFPFLLPIIIKKTHGKPIILKA